VALPAVDDLLAASLAGLTARQREAVTAPDRLLCVQAAAGAGKTRVLTRRVTHRVLSGSAHEDRVLVCTFSRKAAGELRNRLWELGLGDELRAGTFHRTALQLLQQHRSDRGASPVAIVPDRRAAVAELVRSPGAAHQVETEIGWAKARLLRPDAYEEAARRHRRRPSLGVARVAETYGRYEAARRKKGVLDLDDLIWLCAEVLEEDRPFAAATRWRWRHVFVDEMQDVNPAQFRLLRQFLGDESDLFVVGDPHQSVYGWNGADPELLRQLPVLVPGTRVLDLDENHRCTPQIVGVAAAVLGLEGPGSPTSRRSDGPIPRVSAHELDTGEAAWVAREVYRARRPGGRWCQIALLARTNAQLLVLADALAAARIPFHKAGDSLGPASDLYLDGLERDSLDQRVAGERVSPSTDGEGGGFDSGDEYDADEYDTTDPGYRGRGAHPKATHRGPSSEDDDAVVLSTFHRAKGLQWPTVFVVGLADGLVPIASARSEAARLEERRLLYVALTRAEDKLVCSWARFADERARAGDRSRVPTPWLEEFARARAELERAAAPAPPEAAAAHLARLRARLGE
jgi:DNA helicase II / ATP-dependent DNA helicase PcrA